MVAHGNLIVNQIYIDRCLEAKYQLNKNIKTGSILTLTTRYLSRSVSVLMEFGMLLIFTRGESTLQILMRKPFRV